MKRLSCFLATVAFVFSTAVASAQNTYRPPTGSSYPSNPVPRTTAAAPPRTANIVRPAASGNIAVIDMARVFKEHARLTASKESMKNEVKNIEATLQQENERIRKKAEQLRELNIGSPDYTNLDSEITNRKAKLQANAQLQNKKLMLREAEMFHAVYQEVQREIEAIAVSRGLLLVLQYADIKCDASHPESVMQNITKQVLWHNKAIDITDEVIARVNRGVSYGGTATRPTGTRQPTHPY